MPSKNPTRNLMRNIEKEFGKDFGVNRKGLCRELKRRGFPALAKLLRLPNPKRR